MINVGIIGLGKMGLIRLEEISKLSFASVLKIYDPNSNAELTNARSPEEIIHSTEIDVIFICTPNSLNMNYTISALNNGKHVFCEKPPALSAKEVMKIKECEDSTGKVLMYGFNHRHHGSIIKMKSVIDSKELGKVLWMRGRYGKSVDKDFFNNWRSKKDLSGGGILIDQGIHMLDLFLYLGGDFDKVHAAVSNLYWELDVEDNVFATFENTETGLVASLHSTMTQWRHLFSLEVFLEKGSLNLNGLKTSSKTYGDEVLSILKNKSTTPDVEWEDEQRIEYKNDRSWELEINEFFSAVQENRKVKLGRSDDALKVMRIVDQIYSFAK